MYGSATFSRIERCIRRASARSAGTYTTPALMASAGCRNETGAPLTRTSPESGRRAPARMSNSSSWPCPSRAATPRTSPARSSKETSCSRPPTASSRAASRGVVAAIGAPPPARAAICASDLAARSPSMRATIRSSEPSLMSTTPTVAPSRRTVARSHTAAISMSRWEMKMMQRSDPRWFPMTCRTRSVRSAGSAAVISSSISTWGSIASARARSMTRRVARGRSRAMSDRSRSPMPSSCSQWRNGSTGVFGQAKVGPDVQVRDDRRLLVDRDDAALAGLGRGPGHVRLAADRDRAAVRMDGAR